MASTTPSQTNCRASSALSHCDRERPTTSGRSQASLTTYNATTGEKTGRRPGRFLSYKPSRPYATKRSAHLRTCRSRNSTCLAVAAKVCPSANSRMARARLARPTGVFCRRSHPDKVVRVGSSISIWSADLRPCMASSRLVLCRSYGKSTSLCPVFQPLFNGDLYLGFDPYMATGRQRQHGSEAEASAPPATAKERMAAKVRTPAGKALYARRKVIVEPVFGQIKEARGFRRFLLRGLEKIRGEWRLVCLTHNLLKLWRYGSAHSAA